MSRARQAGPLVEFVDACVSYPAKGGGQETVVRDLSAVLREGDAVAIIGPSGSGKTTLLRAIAGQQPVARGRLLHHFDLSRPGQCGYVSQSNSLLPWLDLRDNVAFPLSILGVAGADAGERVDGMLREVGLEGHARKLPREVSGGMARRAVLARALIYGPRLLLLDEPFGGLDAATRYRLVDLLLQLRERHGFTQVCVEHDVDAAARLSTRFWVLDGPGRPVKLLDSAGELSAALARAEPA